MYQAENGIEPTLAQIVILTHKPRKDGRPLDEESARTIDMINEKLSNSEGSNEQHPRSVAWKGDLYSQVLGNEKTGYVRGLGLGPTPSTLWGSRSSFGKDDSSNEMSKAMRRNAPNELSITQTINGVLDGQVPDVNSGHERVQQSPQMLFKGHSVAENNPSSHDIVHLSEYVNLILLI
ncbi:hypothetical protein HAX54_019148 [Datura stramonium]|uniref:Uncharacterized protein n=1 Tax=Datura stramonium TaxID=4076 RepID=A0ABS8UQR6_DATST|nr:hypothetical protein [Datura stramonium]